MQILKTNLWLIYRKRVEFIVYIFIFEFWKIKLLRPSRTSVQGQKHTNFGFLTFKYALKTRPWADHFKNIVLYLLPNGDLKNYIVKLTYSAKKTAISNPFLTVCYWEENICKQIEIHYLLKVLLSITLDKLPWAKSESRTGQTKSHRIPLNFSSDILLASK